MYKVSDIKINIPKYPRLIINTLKKAGFDAYIVGGCVRDAILGKTPSDYDITTNAKPNEVKELFKRTIDTGIKHGTVTVLFYEYDKPLTYEVTTYRIDGEYDDARHPKNVTFVTDLKEDLLRRDFTVNAMAYNDDKGLVDEFGGLIDLDRKIIRAVGNPVDRFSEDALRLMRAVRFAAKLGFDISDDTKAAIPLLARNLSFVSKERVQVELTKTLTSITPNLIKLVFDLGLAPFIADDFDMINAGNIAPSLSTHIAYACFFYNTNTLIAGKILKELKFDNANAEKILSLLETKKAYEKIKKYYKDKDFVNLYIEVKEIINYLNYDLTYDFINLLTINGEDKDIIIYIKELVDKYKSERTPIFIKDLAVDGNDLISLKMSGQEIGVALNNLLKIVHKNSSYNNRNQLIQIARLAFEKYKGAPYEL